MHLLRALLERLEEGSDPLEMEFQAVVSPPMWMLGPTFGSSGRTASPLIC